MSAGQAHQPAASRSVTVRGTGDLLRLLVDSEGMTRAEIIDETGLSRSTVGVRLNQLASVGLVHESETNASTGGRPATRITFDPGAYGVLAADLGASHATLTLTDLAGRVRAIRSAAMSIAEGPERSLRWVAGAAEELLAETGVRTSELAGVGVGLPGPVEHATGVPIKPPIMPGWDGFEVAAWLEDRLAAPVYVDNDVNMMALGEHTAMHPAVENLIFVKVATGIGAGLICGRRLHRGSVGSAGDLGHVRALDAPDTPCQCGNTGCLEAVAGGRALALELRGEREPSEVATRDLLEMLSRRDRAATLATRRAGQRIGAVLAGVVNLLNPSVIVLGGSVAAHSPDLVAGVREVVFARSLPLATSALEIVPSRLGDSAAVTGAAATAIEEFLRPASVDALVSAATRSA